MNIIEAVKTLLTDFPKINELHVDFASENPDSYAFSSTGDSLISEDIVGNQKRRHTFVLYTYWQSASDFDRLNNSGTLLALAGWLEANGRGLPITAEIGDKTLTGEMTGVTTANGMLYAVPDQLMGGVTYQLQITADYKLYTEE